MGGSLDLISVRSASLSAAADAAGAFWTGGAAAAANDEERVRLAAIASAGGKPDGREREV